MEIAVSVIVPIYGVEKFIGQCVSSLMRQTLESIEFIFIDDATRDDSIKILNNILELYPERKRQVSVLHHSVNKGLPAARNTGTKLARGEYVFQCDADDFLDEQMLERLYKGAVEADADFVWSDFLMTFARKERYMKQPSYNTVEEALKGMLCGEMKYNVWNKLVRRSLYVRNSITFPDGYGMGEDMTMIKLCSLSRRVSYVPNALYHYVKTNAGAFSQTYSSRHIYELKHNVAELEGFLRNAYGSQVDTEIGIFKLEAKHPFLITDGRNGRYQLWTEMYPEANQYIMKNTHTSFRRRFLQWCAWKGHFGVVWIHYQLAVRFLYGVIYR